jgi:hypothetical protein
MTQFWLEVQLNVDTSRGSLADAAYVWFDTLTQALTPAERAELAGLPAATRINPLAEGPQGEPGKLYGLIEVDRSIGGGYPTTERRHLSDEGLEWLRGELADLPKKVTVWIGRFTENGFLGGRLMFVKAWPLRDTPAGWSWTPRYRPISSPTPAPGAPSSSGGSVRSGRPRTGSTRASGRSTTGGTRPRRRWRDAALGWRGTRNWRFRRSADRRRTCGRGR